MLPNLSKDYIHESKFCSPQVILPDYVEPLKSALSTTELRQRVHNNIDWLPYFPKSTVDFPALELWMKQDKLSSKPSPTATLLVLNTVDQVMWKFSISDFQSSLAGEAEADVLVKIIDRYRQLAHAFRGTEQSKYLMLVELNSRELLVTWLAYCAIFSSAKRLYPGIMNGFGVALHCQDLKHLVLSDRRAIDAMCNVAKYLESNT